MSGAALILVRHGRPKIDPDTAPTSWPLCEEGRDTVAKLAERIAPYAPGAVVSSPEPKALETARVIGDRLGLKVELDPGFHEHKRPPISFGTEEEFRARIAKVFAAPQTPLPGGESPVAACERLAAALAQHQVRPLVAVSHATVLSLYLAERLGLDAHDIWRSLHMPDAFVLDADGGLIARLS